MPAPKPTYRERKLQRAFCDLHDAERRAFENAQEVFYRREGLPARMGDIVRGSIAQFCARQGVSFPSRDARQKAGKQPSASQLMMWPEKAPGEEGTAS